MADHFYLIEFNQNAENTLELINIDLADSLTGIRRVKLLNFGVDDSGWRTIGWAPTQKEAHDFAENFLHQYYSNYPERFPRVSRSTSNLADECQNGYQPGMRILPRQTYK